MKKLFLIAGLLISLFSQSQRLGQPIGGLNTLVYSRGSFMADQGLINSRLDTLNHPLKDSSGALTFWQNKLWLRVKPAWVAIGSITAVSDGNNYPTTLNVTGTTTKTITLTLLDGSTVVGTFNDLNTGIALTNYYTKSQTDSAIAAHSSSGGVNADWNSTSGLSQILNKPALSTVATTGSYNDLTNKPIASSGTVTLVAKGFGIKKDGDITTTGTINVDSTVLSTKDNVQKVKDSLQTQITLNSINIINNLTRLINDSTYLKGLIDSKLSSNQPITVTATGDATGTSTSSPTAPSLPLVLATVNSNVGTFTNATVTVNAKGLVTAVATGSAGTTQTTAAQTLTATAGQTVFAFTSIPSTSTNFIIFVNGGKWDYTTGYTYSGNNLTTTSALDLGDKISLVEIK